jgi:D-beta-D-heptose 7-phosphate kinase/D-beta-D-heptose 1-phosphate adenosyltransferase
MEPPLSPVQLGASLDDFSSLHVLVLGDLFLDIYLEGQMFEISKEGPIPVVRLDSRVGTPGAAGNLACSLKNLGASVSLVSLVGEDTAGDDLLSQMGEKGIDTSPIIRQPSKPTLTYTKIRARVESAPSREILRMDVLPDAPIDSSIEDRVLASIEERVAELDGIIVLDQVDHLVTKRILGRLTAMATEHNIFLQGSSRERLAEFQNFDLVIPNDQEALGAIQKTSGELSHVELAGQLRQLGSHDEVLLTLGPGGMAALGRDQAEAVLLPTHAREILDVTGAGDAVSSTVLLGRLSGWDLHSAAWAASRCASIVIGRVGTHHVSLQELRDALAEG